MKYFKRYLKIIFIALAIFFALKMGEFFKKEVTRAPEVIPHKPPILTVAAIIEVYQNDVFQGIVLIDRGKAPWGKALPGGKVEYAETVEEAIRREMKEEVNLDLEDLRQFHVYSDPDRDFRHHSVEVNFLAKAYAMPRAGDDAANAYVIPIKDIPWDAMAFDHDQILKDYLRYKEGDGFLAIVH